MSQTDQIQHTQLRVGVGLHAINANEKYEHSSGGHDEQKRGANGSDVVVPGCSLSVVTALPAGAH